MSLSDHTPAQRVAAVDGSDGHNECIDLAVDSWSVGVSISRRFIWMFIVLFSAA
jgi:hypothetical protein